MKENIPKVLYHYCSIETFYNIVINKNLWLTDSYSTNDYMENRWILSKIKQVLTTIINDDNREYFDKVIQTYNMNNIIPFISCFSETGDLLSQWRAYTNDGTGLAIGFNTDYFRLKHELPYTMAVFNENSIGLHEIIYDEKKQIDLLKKLLVYSPDINLVPIVSNRLKQLSNVFKNPAFNEEKEWRIIHTPMIMGSYIDDTTVVNGAISECKFRVTQIDIAPYFTLPFSEEKNIAPIAEIILGPKNKIAPYKLQTFLSINKLLRIPIKTSRASYR